MTKKLLLVILILSSYKGQAQIEMFKVLGKDSKKLTLGWGLNLNFSYPLKPQHHICLEGGVLFNTLKEDSRYGLALVPVKAGYRYVIDSSGTGFYVEPKVGYNVYGISPADSVFRGLVWSIGVGYLFKPIGGLKFDLGLRYESAKMLNTSINYIALRLSHNILWRFNRNN